MRIIDWRSDVCSSDLTLRKIGHATSHVHKEPPNPTKPATTRRQIGDATSQVHKEAPNPTQPATTGSHISDATSQVHKEALPAAAVDDLVEREAGDRKITRLNYNHYYASRMAASA